MGAPRVPRKRRPSVAPYNARKGVDNPLYKLWHDPATRPLMLERASRGRRGRPAGVADGYTEKQTQALRATAEVDAERIIEAMQDEDLLDDSLLIDTASAEAKAEALVDDEKATARAAMKEAITVVLMPGNTQTKLAAIRTVLEYTKAKPASTVNNNVNAAEDFLRALADKDKPQGI